MAKNTKTEITATKAKSEQTQITAKEFVERLKTYCSIAAAAVNHAIKRVTRAGWAFTKPSRSRRS